MFGTVLRVDRGSLWIEDPYGGPPVFSSRASISPWSLPHIKEGARVAYITTLYDSQIAERVELVDQWYPNRSWVWVEEYDEKGRRIR